MSRSWTVWSRFERITILRAHEVPAGTRTDPVRPEQLEELDPHAWDALVDLYDALGGTSATMLACAPTPEARDQVLARLLEAARDGELVAEGPPDWKLPPLDAEPEDEEDAPAATREATTWIELELVDEDGNPVPGAHYRVELPDGRVREGRLDRLGLARLDGIDPGTCRVSFPALDGRDWRAA